MLYYKGVNGAHIVINRDRLEEAITDVLMDNKEYKSYGAAAEQANSLIQKVLAEDAKSVLSDLLL